MLTARERLARQRAQPLLVALSRALSRLTSVLTVMNTGAHPDDEQSGMLAVLRFDQGMRVVIACSTRGEGGQNSLGPERDGALGVLRTRELEEAARVLDADIAWLGFGPDDPVHDFGFSKNGAHTLGRWGGERILERLVRAYRRERPDIVIPTFLDVPGQHGHHRAMTEAAEAAMALAADPEAFPEHFAEGLAPWRVAKYYLPAWPGGGATYDDELPPPGASVAVVAPGPDPATGAAFAEIGEWSRELHASQGMGQWSPEPKERWPLHLRLGPAEPEDDVRAHLPATLTELGRLLGGSAAPALAETEVAINQAIRSFPDRSAIIGALATAAHHLAVGEAALTSEEASRHGHRLARKRVEIDAALMLAAGVRATAWVDPPAIAPGGATVLSIHIAGPEDLETGIDLRLPGFITAGGPAFEAGVTRVPLQVSRDAPLSSPFVAGFSSLTSNGLIGLGVTAEIGGRTFSTAVELEEAFEIVPLHSLTLEPEVLVLPLARLPVSTEVAVRLGGPPAPITMEDRPDLATRRTAKGFRLDLRPSLTPGRHTLPLRVGGSPAYRSHPVTYPHIGRSRFTEPLALEILGLDLQLPAKARIGYVGSGSDRVGLWLRRMGLDVTDLDAAALAGDLSGYTGVVVGIFAFGFRPDLVAATEKLHQWVEAGGHLLTLYHRPSDGWNPARTPPRRLVIGSPSLRWRVTDPWAEVELLQPNHPLLTGPNPIGPADWAGWDKERGLYFAAEWDPVYQALLAMHDADENPLRGGLLSARLGRGRHTHTSLVLHHQLDKLVPGAFRLMANLIQPAD